MPSAYPNDALKLFLEWPKAAKEPSHKLTEISRHALLFDSEVSFSTQMSKCIRLQDDTIRSTTRQFRQTRMPDARVSFLADELDLLKRKVSTGCDMVVVRRKVADAKGDIKKLGDGLCRYTFDSYVSSLHNIDQSFITVSYRVRRCLIVRRRRYSSVCMMLFAMLLVVFKSCLSLLLLQKRSLNLTVRRSKRDDSTRLGLWSAHTAKSGQQQSQTRAVSDSEIVPMGDTSYI